MIKKLCLLILLCLMFIPIVNAEGVILILDLNTSANIYYNQDYDLVYRDISKYTTISGVDVWARCASWSATTPVSGTKFGNMLSGANITGTYTATWSGFDIGTKSPSTLRLRFTNLTSTGLTGERAVKMSGLKATLGNSNSFPSGGVATLTTITPELYAVNFFSDGVSRYTSTINTIYGGGTANQNTTFIITETGNYTNKLENVNILLSNGQSVITNSSGMASLFVFPFSDTYTYSLTKSGYISKPLESLSSFGLIGGTVYNTMVAGGVSSEYYITVSPGWIPAGGSQYLYGQLRKYGTSSTNLTDMKSISWQWHKWQANNAPYQVFPYYDVTNNNNWLEYQKQPSGIYNGWSGLTNSMSVVKTAALPNPLSLNPVGQTGTIITELYATDIYGNNYYFNTSNLIGDNTTQNTHTVKIQDAYTGGALLFGFISLKNELTNIWFNVSAQTGEYIFTIAPQTPMTVYCNASGYQDRTYTGVISGINTISYCNMMASGYVGSLNKTQVIVYTRSVPVGSGSSLPIEDVYVIITQLNESISKSDYSNSEGTTIFSANISTSYTITASKTGFLSASQTINTAAINPYEVYLYLGNPYGTTPVTYTPIPTLTPTMTNVGGQVINGTETTCTTNTGNLSPVESIKNTIACFGFSGYLAQSLALASLIIMVFLVIGGKAGKALGAALGGIIGFLMCIALGILPLWILIAFIIIGVGAIAIRALLAGE